MIVRVSSHKKAAIRYWFDNGNQVSIVFGRMTYSDNHDIDFEKIKQGGIEDIMREDLDSMTTMASETVEIMTYGDPAFVKWFEDRYGDNPSGYVPASEILPILEEANRRVYLVKEDENAENN